MEEFRSRGLQPDDPEVRELQREVSQGASYHFGDPHLNVATLAGLQRMLFKAYDRRHIRSRPTSAEAAFGRENKGIPRSNKTAESWHDRDAAPPLHPAAWIFAACTENSCQIPAEGV